TLVPGLRGVTMQVGDVPKLLHHAALPLERKPSTRGPRYVVPRLSTPDLYLKEGSVAILIARAWVPRDKWNRLPVVTEGGCEALIVAFARAQEQALAATT